MATGMEGAYSTVTYEKVPDRECQSEAEGDDAWLHFIGREYGERP